MTIKAANGFSLKSQALYIVQNNQWCKYAIVNKPIKGVK